VRFDRHPIWGEQAAWSFEGHTFDLTRNGRDLTLRNSPTMGNGVLALNGTNQYADTPDATALRLQTATILFWARIDSLSGNKVAIAKFGGGTLNKRSWRISARDDVSPSVWEIVGSVDGIVADPGGFSYRFPAVTLSAWRHIAVVLDRTQTAGSRVRLYSQGVAVASTTTLDLWTTDLHNSDVPITVGAALGTSGTPVDFFPGALGEISLYNRAWSAADIAEHYQSTRGKYA